MSADVLSSPAGKMDDSLFLEKVRRQMLQFAVQQLGDLSLAEDVVQDALVGALRNQKSFEGRAALRSWMFAILKNKIVDSIRQKSRAMAQEQPMTLDEMDRAGPFESNGHWRSDSEPQPWRHPDEILMDADFWRVFGICLDHLPPRQSRAFMMREVLAMETEEICVALDITATNLHVMLHRARLELRACLQKCWFSDGSR